MRLWQTALFVLGSLSLWATNLHAAAPTQLRIHGSNTIGAELMPVLAESWLKGKGFTNVSRQPLGENELQVVGSNAKGEQLVIEIKAHGSSTAFADLGKGASDIGMASRPIKAAEVNALAKLGKLNDVKSEYVLGLDGVAVIVNPANPLSKLDKGTLRKIFTGEVKDWSEVGGKAGAIHVLARDAKSGTFDTFNSLVLDDKALAADAKRFESNEELSDKVATDPAAIGFTGLAYVKKNRVLAINDGGIAIPPTPFSVATEDYALARRLFLYVPQMGETSGLAKEFADFAVSAKGQQMIDQVGFISQEIRAEATEFATDLPDEYKQLTQGAKRLSLNFRFSKGSAELDNKAKRDEERLVAYMKRDTNAKGKLLLFGFSDSNEAIPMVALALSTDRADNVADRLIRHGLKPLRVRGFGAVAAVAANDSEAGRHKNRRVEVWVK
ncbi:MAG TPA: phosphate ABC transporter substrate-binding/OmpA family protein [Gammaproteobacteria bacterium]